MTNIEVRQMRSEDEAGVLDLVWEFFRNETIGKGLDVDICNTNNPKLYFDALFMPCVEDGVSAVAVDTTSGQVVGIRLASVMHKGVPDKANFAKDHPESRNIANVLELLTGLYKGLDLYAEYDVDKLVSFRIMSVAPKYQRQGIATKLVQKTLELSKARDIPLATAEATSAFTAKLFQNLGFEKLVEQCYDSLKVGEEHVQLPEELKQVHKTVAVYIKRI